MIDQTKTPVEVDWCMASSLPTFVQHNSFGAKRNKYFVRQLLLLFLCYINKKFYYTNKY